MNPLIPTIPTLAVSAIYCIWHAYHQTLFRRVVENHTKRILRERVTFMLWKVAQQAH